MARKKSKTLSPFLWILGGIALFFTIKELSKPVKKINPGDVLPPAKVIQLPGDSRSAAPSGTIQT